MSHIINRRACLQGLIGVSALVGVATPSLAKSAGDRADIQTAWHVERLQAQILATTLAPQAQIQLMPARFQSDMGWWQELAGQLHGQSIVAVLDDRAAVLWDAMLTPLAIRDEQRVWRPSTRQSLHVLHQRF